MGSKSDIEWTDASWTALRARNILAGHKNFGKVGWHCEHATTGCEFCYAESLNLRLGTGLPFKPGHRKDIEIFLDAKILMWPVRWQRPRMVFVCSMTDLFADFVKTEWIDKKLAVMAMTPRHTYQILTKRSARMRAYFADPAWWARVAYAIGELFGVQLEAIQAVSLLTRLQEAGEPLPNVWLGVSAERQQEAEERVPNLLATMATVRFLSAEPLLDVIHLDSLRTGPEWTERLNALTGLHSNQTYGPKLDQVIVGGESGRDDRARPLHPKVSRLLRDQCVATDVAFFFKQHGTWVHESQVPVLGLRTDQVLRHWPRARAIRGFYSLGKEAAGAVLDGSEWKQMPATLKEAA